jgi:hypothetical protein
MDFDFCQVLYTAIDEINIFRLRQEDIPLYTQEIIRKQHNRSSRQASAEIRYALSGEANHLDDGQARPKLDYY